MQSLKLFLVVGVVFARGAHPALAQKQMQTLYAPNQSPVPFAVEQAPPPPAQNHVQIPSLKKAEQKSPFERGCNQMMHKNFAAAITSFSEAISDNGSDVNAYFRRGQSFFCLGNYPEAIRDFEHAAAKGAMDPNLYVWTGTAHARLSNDQMAIINYEKAMRLNPKLAGQPSAQHNEQVGLTSATGKSSESAATTKSVESATTAAQTEAATTMGSTTTTSIASGGAVTTTTSPQTVTVGSSQNAVKDYQTAAKNVLDNMTGSFVPGVLYSGIKNQSGALVELGVLDIGDAAAIIGKGDKHNDSSIRASLRKLDDGINAQPQDAKLYFQRARLLMLSNKQTEGLADLTRAIDLDKTNPHYYLARAFYHYQHDETRDADADIRQAQELNPIIPGELSFELSDKQKAEKKL